MTHDFKAFPELTNNQMMFFYWESPHKQITKDFEARVVKVTDGDTIRVDWEERNFSFPVRFIYIGAPELKEEGGKESQKWLESLLLNEIVDIEIDPDNRVGKWGRILGRIKFMGMDINELSMTTGHSIPFEDVGLGKIPTEKEIFHVA